MLLQTLKKHAVRKLAFRGFVTSWQVGTFQVLDSFRFLGKSDAVKESLRHAPPIEVFVKVLCSDSDLGSLLRLWFRIFVETMIWDLCWDYGLGSLLRLWSRIFVQTLV